MGIRLDSCVHGCSLMDSHPISTEDGMNRSRNGEKEKDLRVSSNDESMPCLQHVPVQRVGSYLAIGRPVKISQTQFGNTS